jgi:glutamine cyclotransferase
MIIRELSAGVVVATFALCCASFANAQDVAVSRVAEQIQYRVVDQFPRDARLFTQGLEWHDGRFIESSGGYGVSVIAETNPATGALLRAKILPREVFAEGLTRWHDRIVQLTWREGLAFIFDLDLQLIGSWRYTGEGWGLTHDEHHFIMSDGSARLSFRRRDDFTVARTVTVTDGGQPVTQLNELEYAHGHVFANLWHSDRIAMIDPKDGKVRAWLDLSALRDRFDKPAGWNAAEHVLNGIAYHPDSGHFYVTGKCWPRLFELQLDLPLQQPPMRAESHQ